MLVNYRLNKTYGLTKMKAKKLMMQLIHSVVFQLEPPYREDINCHQIFSSLV